MGEAMNPEAPEGGEVPSIVIDPADDIVFDLGLGDAKKVLCMASTD